MKRICRVLAAIVCMALLWEVVPTIEAQEQETVKQTISIEEFGAYPSDGEDDTEAFVQALATGKAIQLNSGTYEVSVPLRLTDQTIIGAGSGATILSSTCEDKTQPVVQLGGRCTLSDLTLQFDEKLISCTETQGERVGIWLGNGKPADGSQLKNLRFICVGTAIYAPNQENAGASRLLADTLYVASCSYRGVDFQKSGQYGNTFSNLYIGGSVQKDSIINAGFAVEGEEYNLVVEQLNLEISTFDSALLLKNCYGARMGSIHVEGTAQSAPDTGILRLENSDVFIDGVTLYYNAIDYPNCSLVELGNAGGTEGNRLEIGTLHLKGLNSVHPKNHPAREGGLKNPNARGFKTISRTGGASGTYEVDISGYVWYTWHGEADMYRAFPCDEAGIRYLSKGIR